MGWAKKAARSELPYTQPRLGRSSSVSCNVLLVASGNVAAPVAENLRDVFTAEVTTAKSRVEGLSALRRGEFDLVLVEEAVSAGDAEASDLLYELAGAAARRWPVACTTKHRRAWQYWRSCAMSWVRRSPVCCWKRSSP